MKKYILLSSISLLFTFLACNKEIEDSTLEAYTPAKAENEAGVWKTYILTKPDEVAVTAPSDITSDAYKTELAAVKTAVTNVTNEQRAVVTYWGAGTVYRWNEIARELAAKYNIPPAADANGKYPVPNADSSKANPNYYPKFPFANPPYASRALAYLSVAQYDALVASSHYKKLYSRKAPSKNDNSIVALLPIGDGGSYPCDEMVIAAASATVLKAMFPLEVAYIDEKVKEVENARLWAGANVTSDLIAGAALGSGVGAKIMARAKTDGMGAANNQTLTAGMIDNAKKLGLTEEWKSQELPVRPPLLPNFGNVLPWNFVKTDLPTIRPAAPPALGSEEFKRNIQELVDIAKKPSREQIRIANYWADGPSSYTPPGHWHRIAANLCRDNKYSEVRTARTLALVGTTLQDAGISCWETKYYYYYPRPHQMDNRIKTTVGLPNFPSYTSGHSTFSSAAATVLGHIFPNEKARMDGLAKEASESRIYGCIHYRFDCEKGLEAGKKVGGYAIERAKKDGGE
jgi:membrane-associated phospholipid phosphatase